MPKRNASGAGSIRQRPDGRWEGRVTVGIDPGTGQTVRRSVYGATQAEVRKELTAILGEIDKGTYKAPDKTTVSQWFDEWLTTFCANKLTPLTLSTYRQQIENHIKPAIGAMPIQAVRGVHVQRIYNSMSNAGLSPKTVKNAGAIMHRAFSIAVKQGIIVSNPVDGAEPPKAIKHEIKPLTDEEISLFLAALQDEPMGNAFALCLFAGLRKGECLGLSWGNVDFNNKRLTICQQLQQSKDKGGHYFIAPYTKSNKPRTIAPPDVAFEYLREEQTRQLERRLKAGKAWSNTDDLVFTDALGQHYTFTTFFKHFKRITAGIGRPDARPHDLRHTAATVAIANGSDIKSVQSLLGHATAAFTMDVYAHTTERMMEDTAARVQSYYDKLKAQA